MADQSEAQETRERKRALILEMAVVLGLTWLGSSLTGIGDFFFYSPGRVQNWWDFVESGAWLSAMIALPIYLLWNNREDLRKLGFRRFDVLSLGLATFLFLVNYLMTHAVPTSVRIFGPPASYHGGIYAYGGPVALFVPHLFLAVAREEIVQRGYLSTRLREIGFSPLLTVLVGAIVFTIPHINQGIGALVPIFGMGVLFTAAFLKYRQIWPLILAHSAYNLVIYWHYFSLIRRYGLG